MAQPPSFESEQDIWNAMPGMLSFDAQNTWTCKLCTLINSLDTTTCDACGSATDDMRAIERASVPMTRNQALSQTERAQVNRLVDLIASEQGRLIGDRRIGISKKYRGCFHACEAIDFLVRTEAAPEINTRVLALEALQRVVDADLAHAVVRRASEQVGAIANSSFVSRCCGRLDFIGT